MAAQPVLDSTAEKAPPKLLQAGDLLQTAGCSVHRDGEVLLSDPGPPMGVFAGCTATRPRPLDPCLLEPGIARKLLARVSVSEQQHGKISALSVDGPWVLHDFDFVSAPAPALAPAPAPLDTLDTLEMCNNVVFLYDRRRTAELLKWSNQRSTRLPDCAVVCFVPASKHMPWQALLKPARLLTQIPKGTVFATSAQQPCKARSNLNVWLFPKHVAVEHELPVGSPAPTKPSTTHQMQLNTLVGGIPAVALVDSGAEGGPYMSELFARQHGIHIRPETADSVVTSIQGGEGAVVGHCVVKMRLGHLKLNTKFTVLPMVPHFDLLLSDSWLRKHNAVLNFGNGTCTVRHNGKIGVLQSRIAQPSPSAAPLKPLLSMLQLGRMMKQPIEYCLLMIRKLPDATDQPTDLPSPTNPNLMSPAQVDRIINDYPTVFTEKAPFGGSKIQADIEVIPTGTNKPVSRPLFRYSPLEMAEIERQVKELLALGYIVPSTSPYGAPVLLVKKPRSPDLRMCVDYRALNAITMRNAGPLPRIDDMLSVLAGAKVFSAIDLRQAYHQVQLQPSDWPKTAFKTPFGLYEYRTLSFGLTNAPAAFQSVMNNLFRPYLNAFVAAYLDDILIFSKTPEEHERHLRLVLDVLKANNLTAAVHKCSLNQPQVLYLGHIVSAEGVKADPAKTRAVAEFPRPRDVHQLRSFLGMCVGFRKFIHRYAQMVRPLTDLLKKGVNVASAWGPSATDAFEAVKRALCSTPVLRLPDWRSNEPFDIVCDASYEGVGGTLLQGGHPVAYESRKLIAAEQNYAPTELEMLAVFHCCKTFRCYIEGKPVNVYTDHKPNVTFAQQTLPSRRQARWIDLLQGFNLTWHYVPGPNNIADPLSRNPINAAVVGVTVAGRSLALLASATTQPRVPRQLSCNAEFLARVRTACQVDPWFAVAENVKPLLQDNGLFYMQTALVLPNHESLLNEVMLECHSSPCAGHVGRERTLKLLRRYFWWPSMAASVKRFVSRCDGCQRNKGVNMKPGGLLKPLAIPGDPWHSVSLDFVTHLPTTLAGHTSIMVMVDRLTKMVHLAPCQDTADAHAVAKLFLDRVVVPHGVPLDLVSDRDSRFTSKFWTALCQAMGIKQSMSSAFHPQSDGNTERVNRVMEDMLRHYVAADQSDWDQHLGMAEFAINNAYHSSIGTTPFMLNYGRHPEVPISSVIKRDALRRLTPVHHDVPAVKDLVHKMETLLASAKKALEAAQQRQKTYADQARRLVTFAVGDRVLLSTTNLSLKMLGAVKLMPKYVGPFVVVKKVNEVAYQLELPATMKVHDVFHVSLLKLYVEDPNHNPPPPPVIVDGEERYFVERILRHREKRCGRGKPKTEYLVRWQGYGPEHDTWEPYCNVTTASDPLNDYLASVQSKAEHVVPSSTKPQRKSKRLAPEASGSLPERRSKRARKARQFI